jgi:hypothetical protein
MTDLKKMYTVIIPECQTVINSTTPSGAAKKAYSKCVRPFLNDKIGKEKHIIKLQNESGKQFEYEVYEIKKFDKVKRGDKEISYTYSVIVKSKNINKKSPSTKKKKQKTPSPSPRRSSSKSQGRKKQFMWIKKRVSHSSYRSSTSKSPKRSSYRTSTSKSPKR